jgi:hypothetical protein
VASIISVPLAFYFYWQSVSRPELLYAIYPNRTTVVQVGQTSQLRVFFRDSPITSDVTSVQAVFWNDGRQSIKPPDVLKEIRIVTEPRIPILEATIRQQTRDVVEFGLDTAGLAGGEVGARFRILEKGDGAIVQFVYAGKPDHSIRVEGIIEGQGPPRQFDLSKGRAVTWPIAIAALFCASVVIIFGGAMVVMTVRTGRDRTDGRGTLDQILVIASDLIPPRTA